MKLKTFSANNLILTLAGAVFVLAFSVIIPRVNLSGKKVEAASVISFPEDHSQHPNFAAEWWYLNLLVKAERVDEKNTKDLAYVLSFSRIAGNKSLLSSRYDQSTKSFNENTNTGGKLTVFLKDGKYLKVQYLNGQVNENLEELPPGDDRKRLYKLTGKTPEIGTFDLILKERTVVPSGFNTPLLWGGTTGNCKGKISVFEQNDTFYYSIPDLDITGTIVDINGVKRNVKTGKGWIDHQWFNSSPPDNWTGHYWSNLHYTYSNDLYNPGPHRAVGFVTQVYKGGPKYSYWVKRNADGTNECGIGGNIAINNYSSAGYPMSWKIELDKTAINGTTFSNNQIFKPPYGPRFIESASFYTGNFGGKTFTGLGFFETHIKK